MTTWELINAPGVKQVLLIYNYISLLAYAYTAVNNVFMYMDIDLGGAGFPPSFIAAFIAVAGASQAFWILGVFPPLQRRFGTGFVFRVCALIWPFFYAMYPVSNILLRCNFKIAFWILSIPGLIFGSSIAMSFSMLYPIPDRRLIAYVKQLPVKSPSMILRLLQRHSESSTLLY